MLGLRCGALLGEQACSRRDAFTVSSLTSVYPHTPLCIGQITLLLVGSGHFCRSTYATTTKLTASHLDYHLFTLSKTKSYYDVDKPLHSIMQQPNATNITKMETIRYYQRKTCTTNSYLELSARTKAYFPKLRQRNGTALRHCVQTYNHTPAAPFLFRSPKPFSDKVVRSISADS
jgi:hypothetical protein